MSQPADSLTFWDHLDVLRGSLLRMLAAAVVAAIGAFVMKERLFSIVLAPTESDFPLYRLLGAEPFSIKLVNTALAEQFMIHMKMALWAGAMVVSPYILYTAFRFISPALYANERRHAVSITLSAYLMFLVGVAMNYFLVFPLTVRFLGTYQVSSQVANMLTLSSYADTFIGMSLTMGLVFELPVLSGLLAAMGLLKASWMRHFRRHAIVAILVVAAVITPTADVMTLLIVSVPIYMLYEMSIVIAAAIGSSKT